MNKRKKKLADYTRKKKLADYTSNEQSNQYHI